MSSGNNAPDQSNSEEKSKTIGHYTIGKTIGEGTFGKVKLGTHLLTGEKVAIKILEKDKITDVNDVERVAREIHILKLIRHPNIIQLYEIIETPKQLYLIMEYASGGELFEYIVANNRVKEKEACKFFKQIISGIEYIHKLGVVHRDLKPENLLLDHNKDIKIVDFGLSNTYKPGEQLKTACGSPCYAAPEMIAGKKYHGLNVDIWSCGVILFALLCGYLPFEDANTANLYKKILSGEFHIPKFVSNEARELLKSILNTDPNRRYTINDIRKHPWYNIIPQEKEFEGIIIGSSTVPIDATILKELENYNFNVDHAKKCIEANKHNHITTTYYLLLQKYIKNGGSSIADISTITKSLTLGATSPTARDSIQGMTRKKEITITNPNQEIGSPIITTNMPTSPTIQNEINLSKYLPVKGTVNVNVNVNVNLNNLNTSLTKELDRTILSTINSKKHSEEQQIKFDQRNVAATEPDEHIRISEKLPRQLSPGVKTEKPNRSSHTREQSHPNSSVDHTPKTNNFVNPASHRKGSDTYPSPIINGFITPRANPTYKPTSNAVNKSLNLHPGDRLHTEGGPNGGYVMTEAEVIYETLNSSRVGEKDNASNSTSTRNSDVKKRASPSPKAKKSTPTSSTTNTTNTTDKPASKNAYNTYKNIASKHATKSQKSSEAGESRPESRSEISVEKPMRDNFVATSLQKKLAISPRGLNTTLESAGYTSPKNNTRPIVSNSVALGPGSLKEAPGSFIDRLSTTNTGMKAHRGPFHMNSVSTKNPKYLISELTKAVEANKIYHRNTSKFSLKCEKDTIKFEVEINFIYNHENLYLLKFTKLTGDTAKYNELCSLIYQGIDM